MLIISGIGLGLGLLWVWSTIAWGRLRRLGETERTFPEAHQKNGDLPQNNLVF